MPFNMDKLIIGVAISCFVAGCGIGDSTSTENSTTFKNQSNIIFGTVSGRDKDSGAIVAVNLSGNNFGLPSFQNKNLFDAPAGTSLNSSFYGIPGLFIFTNTLMTSFDIEARFYNTPLELFTRNSTTLLRSHFDGTPLPFADITETIKDSTNTTISLSATPPSAAVNINHLTEFAYSLWTELRFATPGLSFGDTVAATNTLLRNTFPTYNLPLSNFAKEPLAPSQTLLINNVLFETYSAATRLRFRSRSNGSVICAGPMQQPLTCTPP